MISIHQACREGLIDDVKQILDSDPSAVNQLDSDGNSPLHIAARYGQTQIAELLIDKGADITLRNRDVESAEGLAWLNGNPDLAKRIRELDNAQGAHDKIDFTKYPQEDSVSRRYRYLSFLSMLIKFTGYCIIGGGVIMALVIANSSYNNYGTNSASFAVTFASMFSGLFRGLICIAVSEGITMLMNIEQNTRNAK